MDIKKAIEIVEALADGVDPLTGEIFAPDSPYQHADVVRALMAAKDSLGAAARRQERLKRLPARAGQPWTSEESNKLIAGFEQNLSISELGKAHERTKGAITSQLVKLGKLEGTAKNTPEES